MPAAHHRAPAHERALVWGAGIASLVQRQSGAVSLVRGGFPVSFCYTYSPSMPFRRVRRTSGCIQAVSWPKQRHGKPVFASGATPRG